MTTVDQKRQAIIPKEYFSEQKPRCQSFEQIINIQPLVSQFTATSSPFKTSIEIPNINFKLSEVYVQADVIVTFTSDSGTDTYALVQPALVKWASSLINQARLLVGSTEASNIAT